MRILGYPPGWLEEIKEYSSGLEFIETTTSTAATEGNQKITYDFDKIIEYPGFNVALSSNFRDVSYCDIVKLSKLINTQSESIVGLALFEFPTNATVSFQRNFHPKLENV